MTRGAADRAATDSGREPVLQWRDATTLRPGSALPVAVIGAMTGSVVLITLLLSGRQDWTVISSIALGLVLLWLYVVRPSAQVSDRGIRLVNPLQVIELSWPAVREVRSKWALELVSSDHSYTAWGVPVDTGRPRRNGGAVRRTSPGPRRGSERGRVEARVVATEIRSLIDADRRRSDGATPRVARRWWDPPSVALLVVGVGFLLISFFI